jgi:putative DNA primase/helicase
MPKQPGPNPFKPLSWPAPSDSADAVNSAKGPENPVPNGIDAPEESPAGQRTTGLAAAIGKIELRRVAEELARTPPGDRNPSANRFAYEMGLSGLVAYEDVEQAFLEAMAANGVLSEDGERQCRLTVRSGYRSGARKRRAEKEEPPPPPEGEEPTTTRNESEASPEEEGAGSEPFDSATGGHVVVDPKNPIATAQRLRRNYVHDGQPTLYRYRGGFWLWDGTCFREIANEAIDSVLWTFLAQCWQQTPKAQALTRFKPNRLRVVDLHSALRAICALDDHIQPPAWLAGANRPAPESLFACKNGLLDLTTGALVAPTPTFFNVYASDVAFDPDAPAPTLWLNFLSELWNGDVETIETLQEWFGYLLSGDTSQQKILLIVGPKRSGKGTIARVCRALLGAKTVAGPTLSALGEQFGLEGLVTASTAFIYDARFGTRTNKGAIAERLLSISGEDAPDVPRKFKVAWTGKLPTRFVILANKLPVLADDSGALPGRYVVLETVQSFYGREDRKLTAKLTDELSGVLNWAIEGCRRLNERGRFRQPASAVGQVEDLARLSAPIKAFLEECCEIAPSRAIAVNALWEDWKSWCQEEARDPGAKSEFGRNLRIAAPSVERRKVGTHDERTPMYDGIGRKRRDK